MKTLPRRLLLVLLVVALTAASARAGGKPAKRPNILYIMSDDHASAAIGAYGSWLKPVVRTPNIDRLAKQGMRFTNAMVTNSICTPSRAAILTGKYSHKNGVYTLADPLDPATVHLATLLQRAGYLTAIFGKWHLHTDPTGFDDWNILPGQGRYRDPILRRKGEKKGKVHKGYSTDVITDLTIDWLKKRDKSKPFLALCHFKAPHRPWDPDPRFWKIYENMKIPEPKTLLDHYENRSRAAANATLKVGENMNKRDLGVEIPKGLKGDELRRWAYPIYMRRYLSCVAAVDENVGRLLAFLEQEGLLDDTIIVYTSDQGFFLGEHGYYDKRFMYEPTLKMPLIIRAPRDVKGGSTSDALVLNIDFAPTLLDYAGLKAPADMQGRSFRPVLQGKTPKDWRTSMYYRYWMHLADHGVPAHYGLRTPRYALIYYYGQPLGMKGAVNRPTEPEWELFDLERDPEELRNVHADPAYAETVRTLTAELNRLKKEVGDTR